MPAKAARRQVVANVAPKQMKAIDRDAQRAGLSRRMFMQQLMEEFLLQPTTLVAGGIYRKLDRERLRFHLSVPLHNAVSKYAKKLGVTISVVITTAVANRYPL
ncbi:hypothetical protein VDP73_21085 [Xanthomonas campestris pv. campestris]|jgi:hypothetical protein|uniref:hypothetical protein n=1 Tax=Xanthomonas TaxID=338 RepID=UPI000AB5B256|nr:MULTISPECIES: hypothetical protein [Xanthomonas]MCC8489086.1 hypothetical protein [Xanthomonas citri pv. fuscans]MCM5545786.1 hypothetical protein [Xanthomonas hortorum pv. pelargonii]MCM5584238.1 hypothetical protein [Xanthomonas hortorum pv. pelargonii]MCM5588511.1 hypothetical protein [Xanthomonas hortorum pv. pelargonii]MCM5596830.1 hypothetical protein [Xanthomonas hortorum pv. pelargonii]